VNSQERKGGTPAHVGWPWSPQD